MEKLAKFKVFWVAIFLIASSFSTIAQNVTKGEGGGDPCKSVQLSFLTHTPGWKVDKIYVNDQYDISAKGANTFVFKFNNGVFSIEDQSDIYFGAYSVVNDTIRLVFQENSEVYESDSANRFPKEWAISNCSQFSLILKSKFYANEDQAWHPMEYRFRAIRPRSN
jgi:hypothetical protein